MTERELRVVVVTGDAASLVPRLSRAGVRVVASIDARDAASLSRHDAEVVVWDAVTAGDPLPVASTRGETPIVVLAADGVRARAGIAGAIRRDADERTLASAVHAVAAGLLVFASDLAPSRGQAEEPEAIEPLTRRERDVLELLPLGLTNHAIAGRLGLSPHTAKFHVAAILGKLGVETRAEAVAAAIRLGLIAV
ncbi:MAG: response regulator transcription factor [Acidobacteriota bacterium]